MSDWFPGILLFPALLLLALSAVVSGFETALYTLRHYHIAVLAGEDYDLRVRLRWLYARLEQNRLVILIPSAVLQVTIIVLAVAILFDSQGSHWRTVVVLMGVLLVGDIAPKLLALARPDWIFRWFTPMFLFLSRAMGPLAKACATFTGRIEERLLPETLKPNASYTQDEFAAFVALEAEAGILDLGESEIIAEILKVGDMTASDCMTSRVDAFALPADLTAEEIFQRLERTDWWRVPLYRESPDQIVGVLDVYQALRNKGQPLAESIYPPRFIPETMPALDVFRDYLQVPHSMVIVLDEFGGTEGVLTYEDMVDAIIRPRREREKEVVILGPDTLKVPGSMRIDDLAQRMGVTLEAEGLDTIGGLVFTRFGQLPELGQRVDLGPVEAEVIRLGSMRIEEVVLTLKPA